MKQLLIVIMLSVLAGCASTRYASMTRTNKDSTYNYAQQLDSLYRAIWQRDSVYKRDSIYIYEKGDTVTKYVEKTLYKWRTLTDTVYRDRLRADTLYIERTDSIMVEKPIYIEKQIKWYNQGFIWFGKLCYIALILWVLFLYLKRKF